MPCAGLIEVLLAETNATNDDGRDKNEDDRDVRYGWGEEEDMTEENDTGSVWLRSAEAVVGAAELRVVVVSVLVFSFLFSSFS